LALLDVEGHSITFIKRFETNSIDTGMMNKYIRTIFLFDESKSFSRIKPLYNSICHNDILLSKYFQNLKLEDTSYEK